MERRNRRRRTNCIPRIAVAAMASMASLVLLSTAAAFAPPLSAAANVRPSRGTHPPTVRPSTIGPHRMSLADVSEFYAQFPLQAAVLTCGVKASVADGIAQVRTSREEGDPSSNPLDDLELRRNLAYILYGGIFVGAACHCEYDLLFPLMFGTEHSLWISFQEVVFDNFVSAPLGWLPPAYLIKAVVYDYPLGEGLRKYATDVLENGLLTKYWMIWVPAQTVSFTVVPDHLRVVFMASVSFFWFILFSTLSSSRQGEIDNRSD